MRKRFLTGMQKALKFGSHSMHQRATLWGSAPSLLYRYEEAFSAFRQRSS